jgi:uncharacterized cupredoxin-like copper-binding protein
MDRSVLLFAVLAATALIVGVACSSGGSDAATTGPLELTVTATELQFAPATLTVQAGRPVQLTIENAGATDHDFVIAGMPAMEVTNDLKEAGPELTHDMSIESVAGHMLAKHTAHVGFVPMKRGAYEYFCSVPGHRDGGMHGTLVVVSGAADRSCRFGSPTAD